MLVLAARFLNVDQFCWLQIEDRVLQLCAAQLAGFVEELDFERIHAAHLVSVLAVAG